jgi:beta-glucosidase
VTDPAAADVAIMRLEAPFETLHPNYVFGSRQHEGSLAFHDGNPDYEEFKRVSAVVPTVVTVYLDRPAILTPIRDHARALIANFGVSDAALIDVLTGRASPEGRLPFELPATMAAVEAQRSDLPHDSRHPLYRYGFGRSY